MSNKIQIDLAEVERLASHGLTQKQIADALGISTRTLGYRISGDADFADAIKKGRALGNHEVANVLYKKAMSGNVAACIFWLKTRGGWSERQALKMEREGVSTVDEFLDGF